LLTPVVPRVTAFHTSGAGNEEQLKVRLAAVGKAKARMVAVREIS